MADKAGAVKWPIERMISQLSELRDYCSRSPEAPATRQVLELFDAISAELKSRLPAVSIDLDQNLITFDDRTIHVPGRQAELCSLLAHGRFVRYRELESGMFGATDMADARKSLGTQKHNLNRSLRRACFPLEVMARANVGLELCRTDGS